MAYGEHKRPDEFQDEDKWWKFTKRQWIIMLPMVPIAIFLWTVTNAIGLLPVGISLTVILGVIDWFIAFRDLPNDKYLYGNSVKVEKLVLRVLLKKLPKNKKIYTKHLNNEYKEWLK